MPFVYGMCLHVLPCCDLRTMQDLTIESTFHELSIHSATFHGILTVTRHPKDLTLFVSDTVAVLDGREATSCTISDFFFLLLPL